VKRKSIYFIQRGVDGPIKIGVAADPYERLSSLQTASPEKLILLGCVRGSETGMHQKFRKHRISGEWFKPHKDVLRFVRLRTFVPSRRRAGTIIKVLVPDHLQDPIEQERKRMSFAREKETKASAVVRACLEECLLGKPRPVLSVSREKT